MQVEISETFKWSTHLTLQACYVLKVPMKVDLIQFQEALKGTGSPRQDWAEGRSPELCRIFNAFADTPHLLGPTLDIGSEGASFFRPIKKFTPHLLPYLSADLEGTSIEIDGTQIQGFHFECDKDLLPLPSQSMGCVLMCDVIEHLLVDPVWTLLEINRVLRIGGHFIVSTPNAGGIARAFKIFGGYHPGTEHEYKPTAIYARHNREWTVTELGQTLLNIGFNIEAFDTNHEVLKDAEKTLLEEMRQKGFAALEDKYYGPDIVIVAKKMMHLTVDSPLSADMRWPDYLYTGFDAYRRRPEKFPDFTTR